MKLSAVIPAYKSTAHLARCLEALADEQEVDEVIVLDGGPDGVVAGFAEGKAGVRAIRAPGTSIHERLGRGVGEARSDVVLLLDDDAFVDPGTPRRLAEALLADPRRAVVQAALRYPDGSSQKSGAAYRTLTGETVAALVPARAARALERGGVLTPRAGGVDETGFVTFCAAAVRRSAFVEAGGFDDRFEFYFDDQDLCRRLVAAGWTIAVRWDAGAVHVGGGTTSRADPASWFVRWQASRMAYLRKHYPRGWVVFAAAWRLRAAAHSAVWGIRARVKHARSDADGERSAREWARAFRGSAG
jgi:GT2 family glycosyltransferase